MDFIHTETYPITTYHTDRYGRAKPACLLHFAQEAAEAHCVSLGADWDTMASKNLFWAVIRQRMEITRLPEAGEVITVKTWPMPTTRVAYPRATEGFDQDGNSVFKLISLWVLMDTQTRAMVLPGKSGVEVAGTTFGTELKAPAGLPAGEFEHHAIRTVRFTDLDKNGHMNNARYLEWLSDLLPASFHQDHPAKAFTICYMSEALEGQQVNLSWSEGEVLRLDGSLSQTDVAAGHTRIFSAQMEF